MDAPGWFGKISAIGDFASRRLPAPVVETLDAWLSVAVDGSRRALGDDAWLEAYLAAPLWRFVCAPGVFDAQWWFGVLMPSCDNVGRYFPLVVAQPRAQPPSDAAALDHLDRWWALVADAALATLDEGARIDAFEAALAALPPWPVAAMAPRPPLAVSAPGGALSHGITPGQSSSQLAQTLAAGTWLQQLEGSSLWWACPPVDARCLSVAHLPDGALFAHMLRPS